jgi:hypothetical protein
MATITGDEAIRRIRDRLGDDIAAYALAWAGMMQFPDEPATWDESQVRDVVDEAARFFAANAVAEHAGELTPERGRDAR